MQVYSKRVLLWLWSVKLLRNSVLKFNIALCSLRPHQDFNVLIDLGRIFPASRIIWVFLSITFTHLITGSSALSKVIYLNKTSIFRPIAGFDDSIRKFVCHVVGITYQHIRWVVNIQLLLPFYSCHFNQGNRSHYIIFNDIQLSSISVRVRWQWRNEI